MEPLFPYRCSFIVGHQCSVRVGLAQYGWEAAGTQQRSEHWRREGKPILGVFALKGPRTRVPSGCKKLSRLHFLCLGLRSSFLSKIKSAF